MGRGVLRPLALRGPAKPLKTGQAGADEAAFLGSWAVESPISAARTCRSRRCGGLCKGLYRERRMGACGADWVRLAGMTMMGEWRR